VKIPPPRFGGGVVVLGGGAATPAPAKVSSLDPATVDAHAANRAPLVVDRATLATVLMRRGLHQQQWRCAGWQCEAQIYAR